MEEGWAVNNAQKTVGTASAQNLIAGSEQLPNVTLAAIFFWIVARFSTSSRALRSAMYRDSESFAKLSEICTSCKIA